MFGWFVGFVCLDVVVFLVVCFVRFALFVAFVFWFGVPTPTRLSFVYWFVSDCFVWLSFLYFCAFNLPPPRAATPSPRPSRTHHPPFCRITCCAWTSYWLVVRSVPFVLTLCCAGLWTVPHAVVALTTTFTFAGMRHTHCGFIYFSSSPPPPTPTIPAALCCSLYLPFTQTSTLHYPATHAFTLYPHPLTFYLPFLFYFLRFAFVFYPAFAMRFTFGGILCARFPLLLALPPAPSTLPPPQPPAPNSQVGWVCWLPPRPITFALPRIMRAGPHLQLPTTCHRAAFPHAWFARGAARTRAFTSPPSRTCGLFVTRCGWVCDVSFIVVGSAWRLASQTNLLDGLDGQFSVGCCVLGHYWLDIFVRVALRLRRFTARYLIAVLPAFALRACALPRACVWLVTCACRCLYAYARARGARHARCRHCCTRTHACVWRAAPSLPHPYITPHMVMLSYLLPRVPGGLTFVPLTPRIILVWFARNVTRACAPRRARWRLLRALPRGIFIYAVW